MDTLQKIYIAYLGVLAVFVCFIAWLAVKLRAERINRIRENKASQTRYDELNTLLNEAVNKVGGLKYSNDSLNTLIEGNKVLLDSHEAKIAHLNNVINEKHEYIEKLQGQIQNLINCISRTGIRDVKGVVRKCNLGEIQSVISGTHPILNKIEKKRKVKLIQPKHTRDWSVPQAFPLGYVLKKGTEVASINSLRGIPDGTKGIVMEHESISYIDWEDGKYRSSDKDAEAINGGRPASSHRLYPINPLDHPEHPQFNKK